jgi:hypothetical protein
MWCNYYARENICKCCGRYDDIHIGKSSGWWDFTFHRVDEYVWEEEKHIKITNRAELEEYLQKGWISIWDEYDKEITIKDFFSLVDEKKKINWKAHKKTINKYGSDSYYDNTDNFFMGGDFC